VLIVAEKYQTGFDQPLLHTMYVDKRLSGIQAVQTLSRLNRIHPEKDETFILDFVNDEQEIIDAFQPYYEQTTVAEEATPQQLYELKAKMDNQQVYFLAEVDEFCKVFYAPKEFQNTSDHAKMNATLDPAVGRFRHLDEPAQEEFRTWLVSYKNLYSFMAQVMPFQDQDLEKLYSYTRFLLTKLPRKHTGPIHYFDDEVSLQYYRLQKISEGSISLTKGKTGQVSGPTSVGTGAITDEKIELSQLITILNTRFGTEFKPGDQLFFDSIKEDAIADPTLQQAAMANTMENFGYVFLKALEGLFIERMEQNEEITAKYLNEKDFKKTVGQELLKQVYDRIHQEQRRAEP
jgi:type I restriction enzyme R subunit